MLNAFLSYMYVAFIGISSLFFFVIACVIRLATFLFDRRRVMNNLFSSFWASVYIWCMPLWSVKITGREKLDMSKSYVFVSNHQSQLDILILYRLFFPVRWISKAEVFRLPAIGWNMVFNGDVPLKRGDKESIRQMMDRCRQLLRQNISIMIFPEGTRSKTGIMRPFKPGAFILAKEAEKPIVPLVINNSKDALPKHSLKFHGSHRMEVKILDEIPHAEFRDMDVDQVADMVHKHIRAHVKEHIAIEKDDSLGQQTA